MHTATAMTNMRDKLIHEIRTDEKYRMVIDEVLLPEILVDLRSDKYVVICSLDFGRNIEILPKLAEYIKNRFDNEDGRLPDKIYILKLSEVYLIHEEFMKKIVDYGFYFTSYNSIYVTKQEIAPELIFINGDIALSHSIREYNNDIGLGISIPTTYGFSFPLLLRTRKRIINEHSNTRVADYNSATTKHFICLNGGASTYRADLVTRLHKTNIIDKCYWSWLRRYSTKVWDDVLDACSTTDSKIFDYKITKELDMTTEELLFEDNQDRVDYFYYLTDSLIDIGIETTPDNHQFITEKTWKPYLFGKVSFFFNCQSYYAILKNLGFELYDEIFDYSFDTIKNTDERLDAYFNEIKRISEIPIEELQNKILNVEDKILRNRNHAWHCDVLTLPILKEYPILAI